VTATIDLDEVRAALTTRAVLDFYGWKVKREGDELVSRACPVRADHSRESFKINAASGRWQCFPCGTAGDLLDFIAAVERIAMPADFALVVEKAAAIAGVGESTTSVDERLKRRAEWQERRRQAEAREREERRARDAAAVPTATAHWDSLLRGNPRGHAYLVERQVDEICEIREFGDVIRFDPHHAGSPATPLYARDGAIRNVVARRVPELGEPKTPGLKDCPTAGTLINAVCQIEPGRDVVLTEGVMDSLTARLAWHSAIVLGAHGAGNLPKIAKLAVPAIAAAKARLLVVPHRDRRGYETAMQACSIAVEAGLSLRRGTLAIIRHGAKDLNDAWRSGWRSCT
jgi:hypothetical protein